MSAAYTTTTSTAHCVQANSTVLTSLTRPRGQPLSAGDRGKTYIDDEVVSVIARLAAETVDGVHQLGQSSLRSMFSGGRSRGVEAEGGMKEAAVDVEIVVEFGYPIRTVSKKLRQQIIESVERMAGRSVVEVNVYVIDVHISKPERRHRRELE